MQNTVNSQCWPSYLFHQHTPPLVLPNPADAFYSADYPEQTKLATPYDAYIMHRHVRSNISHHVSSASRRIELWDFAGSNRFTAVKLSSSVLRQTFREMVQSVHQFLRGTRCAQQVRVTRSTPRCCSAVHSLQQACTYGTHLAGDRTSSWPREIPELLRPRCE